MPIFCQLLYKLVLVWRQFDMAEVEGARLIRIAHHIPRGHTTSFQTKKGNKADTVSNFDIRLWQLDLLKILLCFLITHTDMAAQCQESPVGQRQEDQPC